MDNKLEVDVTLSDKSKARIKELIAPRIEALEAAVCWFAQALVESECTIIAASHMDSEACHTFIRETMPVTAGINENRLIVSLGKYSPGAIPMALFTSILDEKEGR